MSEYSERYTLSTPAAARTQGARFLTALTSSPDRPSDLYISCPFFISR